MLLVPPAATTLDRDDIAYPAAADPIRADMRKHLKKNLPPGGIEQLVRELLEINPDAPSPGIPLHLHPAPVAPGGDSGGLMKAGQFIAAAEAAQAAGFKIPLPPRGSGGAGGRADNAPPSDQHSTGGATATVTATGAQGGEDAARATLSRLPGHALAEEVVWWQILDLALHGDGGWILDRLIQPVFQLLAHEVRAVSFSYCFTFAARKVRALCTCRY